MRCACPGSTGPIRRTCAHLPKSCPTRSQRKLCIFECYDSLFGFARGKLPVPHPIQSEIPARIVGIETATSARVSDRRAAKRGMSCVASTVSRHGHSENRRCKKSGAAKHGSPVLVTENLMSLSRRGSIIAALFPKEQVPASTPIPPARSGPSFFSSIVAIPWAQLQSSLRLS
jgi:hypothetical protein